MSTKRRVGRSRPTTSGTPRSHSYRQLQHPFTPQAIFSEDGVARIHQMALQVVQDLGIKILLPEARQIFEAAGALVDHDTQIVRIGSDLVEAALATTPTSYRLRGRSVLRDQIFEDGSMLLALGAGCPNVTDLVRGRRAGSLETTKRQSSCSSLSMSCMSLGHPPNPKTLRPR
jgi:trimethylamine--corrinoid protein Co-methyltransferase